MVAASIVTVDRTIADEFADVVSYDDDLLAAEFAQIVAANWPLRPPRPTAVGLAESSGRRRADLRSIRWSVAARRRDETAIPRAPQRSPPSGPPRPSRVTSGPPAPSLHRRLHRRSARA